MMASGCSYVCGMWLRESDEDKLSVWNAVPRTRRWADVSANSKAIMWEDVKATTDAIQTIESEQYVIK
jgi:hypothetical protein